MFTSGSKYPAFWVPYPIILALWGDDLLLGGLGFAGAG